MENTGGAWRCPAAVLDTSANSLNGVTKYNLVATNCPSYVSRQKEVCRKQARLSA
jgi:hypothetical protein